MGEGWRNGTAKCWVHAAALQAKDYHMARKYAIAGVCLVAFALFSIATQFTIAGLTTTAVATVTFWLGILSLVLALISGIRGKTY